MATTLRLLVLVIVCSAVFSCAKNTADPTVSIGDVYVPSLVCPKAKSEVSITVPVEVSGILTTPQICWVGIYQDPGFGDEVGEPITCGHSTFDQSDNIGFSFNLADGNYAVVIGITSNSWQECYALGATTKQGPKRMAVGGAGMRQPTNVSGSTV